ncbi:MAG: amino acid permease [Myxococcota bacterium]|nr:amino acid permease [Myxococcota bacterium]
MTDTTKDIAPIAGRLRLGTFLGVFTPTALTILGAIMYLRIGWVVGHLGLEQAIVVVVLANVITMLTALSLSSLATSMDVGVGGAYYLISRSFGLPIGGAIGIPLYLSQTLSITLYAFAMAESLYFFIPGLTLPENIVVPCTAALIIGLITTISSKSTTLTLKLQIPILMLIILSIGALTYGVLGENPTTVSETTITPSTEIGFWPAFAVFFPAVTGILSGVSLSGDLANPQKSIPRGVLSAVAMGFILYLIVPVLLVKGATPEALQNNSLVWLDIAPSAWLILPGLWGAVLSSALGSILAAPRTLQALANDGLAPRFLGQTSKKNGEPIVGLITSGAIALAACMLGGLNIVAEWLTVFFLTTYGALNSVACLETLTGNPSFRPEIQVPWWASMIGAIGCFVGMFAINPMACLLALIIEVVIFAILNQRALSTTWGDARSGLWLSLARFSILQLQRTKHDPRNWRPHILVFVRDVETSIPIVKLCHDFGQHRGFVTVMSLREGNFCEHVPHQEIHEETNQLLEQNNVTGFFQLATVPNFEAGVITSVQASGFAGLNSNTAVFGWSGEDPETLKRLLTIMRKLDSLETCSLIYRHQVPTSHNRDIVIWWKGKQLNGDLMLLLAYLLTKAPGWRNSRIVLKSVVHSEETQKERQDEFESMLEDIRIPAIVEVIIPTENTSLETTIQNNSTQARLVFLGLSLPSDGTESAYAKALIKLTENLPSTLLVRNAGQFRGSLL